MAAHKHATLVTCPESNDVLKLKFKKLHQTIVNSVNSASIMDFLFQEGVIGDNDMSDLLAYTDNKKQTRSLLNLLHMSGNPQAFVKLYAAVKQEASYLQWLIDCIDKFDQQSFIDLPQHRYSTDHTGACVFKQTLIKLCLY